MDDLPARDTFLGNIIEDTARLDRLVTRLLELSRLEADTTATEHFDYEALVREVVDALREHRLTNCSRRADEEGV